MVVGRRAKDPLLDAADDYLARLQRYAGAELLRVRDSDAQGERDGILAKVGTGDLLVALDERGTELDTLGLARRVRAWQGRTRVVLAIGGAEGLHPDVLGRAGERLALSRFTLPHRLALVVALEQLYRAHTVVRGEAYHREGRAPA